MASKKKFEGTEVVVSAPRMSKFEEGLYDRGQMTRQQKMDEAMDIAMGFSGPVALSKIDLSKASRVAKWGKDVASRIVGSSADNVARAATTKDDDKKYAKGGRVRGNGIAKRGLTKGKMR